MACEKGEVDIVKILFLRNVSIDPETAASRFFDADKTPLHYACRQGHFKIVKLLIQKNANIFSLSHDNLTPTAIAERQGFANIASFLRSRINSMRKTFQH